MNIGQHTWFSIGVALLLIATCAPLCVSSASLSRAPSPTIDWEVQVNTTGAFFQGVSMCKGTTQGTERAGFVASATGSIWRTLDGVHWEQVNQSPEAAFWAGIFCFPDAQRVIAVGVSNGNGLPAGGIISWSFDGGATWSDPEPMPESGSFTWVQAVHFYNDTDGIILPYRQDSSYVAYYTTSGGKTASDWQVVQLEEPYVWGQSHPIWAFGDVTKTLSYNGSVANLCSSDSAGMSWNCQAMNAAVAVGSFASPDVAIGVDYGLSSFYSTADGGYTWNWTAALPFDLSRSMLTPSDMLWVPNSDVVILVGGTNDMGSIVHSTDFGATWGSSMPELPSTSFNSIDFVAVSETKTEVWAVGANDNSAVILHATVFASGDLRLSGQW